MKGAPLPPFRDQSRGVLKEIKWAVRAAPERTVSVVPLLQCQGTIYHIILPDSLMGYCRPLSSPYESSLSRVVLQAKQLMQEHRLQV